MHAGADFTRGANLRVQCANVFFMSSGAKPPQFKTDKKLSKMLADLSKAGCKALKRHLVLLSQQGMNKIGLRVNMDADSVSWMEQMGLTLTLSLPRAINFKFP